MYISIILKFIKFLKLLKKNKIVYLALPMLLLEGGEGLGHLESPCRHMETDPVPVSVVPTKYRNHHHIHYVLCLSSLMEEDVSPPAQPRLTWRSDR